MSVILKAENISKQYRLGTVGSGTLSDDLKRWWYNVRGKEDPFLKVGAVNDRSSNATEDYVWALREINFEVKQGEVLGIIGKNGAGKSTLLKLLSRVTAPTTGSIKTKGRIASLLEIGTGFHPELTGRENIFMNGAVLGMSRNEIKDKLDEIIAFSGCEKYIDTPVKRYSSGMTVRLGFAVAAHLEPEILVVDEVLAVGDAEFQKKAIGKMNSLSKGEGRTVLFVSHNMVSVQQLCSRCLVLDNGKVKYQGETRKAIEIYLDDKIELTEHTTPFPIKLPKVTLVDFKIKSDTDRVSTNLLVGTGCSLILNIANTSKEKIKLNLRFQLFDKNEDLITTLNAYHTHSTMILNENQSGNMECVIENLALVPGNYILGLKVIDFNKMDVLYKNDFFFDIIVNQGDFFNSGKIPNLKNIGRVFTNHKWINRVV